MELEIVCIVTECQSSFIKRYTNTQNSDWLYVQCTCLGWFEIF